MAVESDLISRLASFLIANEKANNSDPFGQNANIPNAVFEGDVSNNSGDFVSTTAFSESFTDIIRDVISNSTKETVRILQDLNTRINDSINRTEPEVTIYRPEVTSESGIGTAEKVVIGAVTIVVILTIVALILRILGPRFRSKSTNSVEDEKKIPIEGTQTKLGGFTNFGADIESQSSGLGSSPSQDWSQSTGSTPISDWSDISSGTKTPSENLSTSGNQSISGGSESSMSRKHKPTHKSKPVMMTRDTLSVTSLPMYKDADRLSSRSSPGLMRRPLDEKASTHSNLSHLSHPSESRLSLVSIGSLASSMTSLPPGKTTFPIPSRDVVRQLHLDKDRRYPSNTKVSSAQKKEKHVRLSPPNDRRNQKQ